MARIFQTVVKRVTQASGGNGFVASVAKAGIALANRFNLIATEIKPAIAITADQHSFRGPTQAPGVQASLIGAVGTSSVQALEAVAVTASLRDAAASNAQQNPGMALAASLQAVSPSSIPLAPAVAMAANGASGDAAKPAQSPGINTSARISEFNSPQVPSVDIVQVVYNLSHRSGSNAATEANGPCARQDFDTPANAQGLHNATVCACPGNALAARCGRLNMAYADFVGKSELTISQVQLHYYTNVTRLLSASMTLGYNIGAGDVTLEVVSATANNLTAPRTHDITAAIGGDWSKLNALVSHVIADLAALALNDTVQVDAVELEVTASRTDSL